MLTRVTLHLISPENMVGFTSCMNFADITILFRIVCKCTCKMRLLSAHCFSRTFGDIPPPRIQARPSNLDSIPATLAPPRVPHGQADIQETEELKLTAKGPSVVRPFA